MKTFLITPIFLYLLILTSLDAASLPPGWIVKWGYGEITTGANRTFGPTSSLVTANGQEVSNAVSIAESGLILKSDGTVAGYAGVSNVIAVSANLALKSDGTVVALGGNEEQTNVPPDLKNVIALGGSKLVLKSDGKPLSWGFNPNSYDHHSMFIPVGLSNVVALDGSCALRSDGTVAIWSFNGQMGVNRRPLEETNGRVVRWVERSVDFDVIEGLSNVVSIVCGGRQNLALKNDGSVFWWGMDIGNAANGVRPTNSVVGWDPFFGGDWSRGFVTIGGSILTNAVAVASGGGVSMALKSDGTVLTWGFLPYNAQRVPAGLSNVVAVAVGGGNCFAITTNRAVAEKFRQK